MLKVTQGGKAKLICDLLVTSVQDFNVTFEYSVTVSTNIHHNLELKINVVNFWIIDLNLSNEVSGWFTVSQNNEFVIGGCVA
jgi:hypothetical protein